MGINFVYLKGELLMIYKVLFQPNKIENPRRENTRSIYIESESSVAARALVEEKTDYNIELIQELTGDFLDYEQKSPDFKITEL
jgi:DNA-dependent RNA polymerase auxiliary subunit epsilon